MVRREGRRVSGHVRASVRQQRKMSLVEKQERDYRQTRRSVRYIYCSKQNRGERKACDGSLSPAHGGGGHLLSPRGRGQEAVNPEGFRCSCLCSSSNTRHDAHERGATCVQTAAAGGGELLGDETPLASVTCRHTQPRPVALVSATVLPELLMCDIQPLSAPSVLPTEASLSMRTEESVSPFRRCLEKIK